MKASAAKKFLPPLERCMGKVSYSKADAVAAKNWRYKRDRVELRVYECHLGPHWHLTSRLEDFYPGQRKSKYRK